MMPMRQSVSKTAPLVTRSSVSVMNAEKEFKEVFEAVVNAVPIVVPSLVVGAIALDALLPSGILKILDEDGGVASIGKDAKPFSLQEVLFGVTFAGITVGSLIFSYIVFGL